LSLNAESLRCTNVTAPTYACSTLGSPSSALARRRSKRETAPVNADITSAHSRLS